MQFDILMYENIYHWKLISAHMNHLVNHPLSCENDEHPHFMFLRVERKRDLRKIFNISSRFYWPFLIWNILVSELHWATFFICLCRNTTATQMCQRPLTSKYYFIPSCFIWSQVCRSSSGQKEKRTWHTPYKASSVRSCLNSGIIRIVQLWRDFLFSSFTVIEGWRSLLSVFHFTIRYIWLQWCLH